MGTFMMIIAALTALMTLQMLLHVGTKKKLYSYKDIANEVIGTKFAGIFVEIAIFMFSIGVLAVFMGIIGDYVSSILYVIAIPEHPTAAALFFVDKRVTSAIIMVT